MEYYQNRIDSFGPAKSKRTKASSSKPVWPHPSSFKATPKTLAEAGFYFHPDSDNNDNVACFTCGKNLAGWEPDDDPFTIHYEKCRDKCAWAVVRCQTALGDGSFDFSDPTRHPTSKAMEKARLETFAKARWPHDAAKGHGANSKAMAKAGFLCIPTEAGDDTALCLYCELTLSGWDNDDDPYEEHVKRDKKKQTSCPFIKAYSGRSLGKSTNTKRPTSKVVTNPPTQTSKAIVEEEMEDSEDELAALSPLTVDMSMHTTKSKSRASKASSARPSSIAKTPASRRSTRGTSTTGRTPGSRTVSSEVEETDAGSESDAGRRATKSKRKTGRQTKARVSAIAEEEDEPESSRPTLEANDDVEMDDMPGPEPEKKKRGRPPKSAAAKTLTKGKSKKAEVKAEEGNEVEIDTDSPPAPPAKKVPARTRSKANLESDAEVAQPSKAHKRTKSTSKAKAMRDEDENKAPPVAGPASKKKGKQRTAEVVEDEEGPPSAPPAMPKAKAVSRAKPLAKYEGSEDEDTPSTAEGFSHSRADGVRNTTSRESKAISERKSSLSDDAGYATAEAHAEVDRMEVDDEPAPPPKVTKKTQQPPSKAVQPPPRANSRSTASGSDGSQRPSPVVNGVRSSSAVPPSSLSSLTSSSRPPNMLSVSKMSAQDSLKVIEIDSDAEASPERPVRHQPKTKPSASRDQSKGSINGAPNPASQAQKKKLQVEVIIPPNAPKLASSDDVQMRDERPASSPPRPPRSPSRPTKPEIPAPGTPVSAVHRSVHPSPEHDIRGEEDGPVARDTDAVPAASNSPRTYHPFLAQFPNENLAELTEEETDMTLEQYIRREMEVQYAQLKADGERRIEEFKQKAAETRKLIETS
ncbi:hypothetical protein GSI_10733 [Ganoderma sinense ZZ0214-1]|uniref:BIR-domain-containing protein n=1 Tax=Ganoderma sinense ZZ0214-1 TaxID=1077348 RepID=A0A2G8S1D7_9APHY|nr:hypothetical protein GSI_10733 [Ganoderma sinense ZZ0214-1]